MLRTRLGHDRVILLVDDVIGELDPRARAAFLASLGTAAQVFLACTSAEVLAGLPAAAIFLTVLSYNMLGESLRDAIDPKRRGR